MANSTFTYDSLRLPTGDTRRVPVAAATLIHAGVLVGLNATGYLIAADATTVKILGWAADTYDNSAGANADLYAEVEIGVGTMENKSGDALTILDVGNPVFVSTTAAQGWYEVQRTGGASPVAGLLFGFEAETGKPLIDTRRTVSNWYPVPASAAVNATATLTTAQMGPLALITSTTAAAVAATTPTGTELDAAFPDVPIGGAFDFYVTNTGGNTFTVTAGAGVTVTAGAVATVTSGAFRVRRTAAATWTIQRLA